MFDEGFVSRICRMLGLTAPQAVDGVRQEVAARARERGFVDPESYLAVAEAEPEEFQLLLERLVVGETWFFRENESLEWVVQQLGTRPPPCRILCAPCSTGEEAYSLAMLLQQAGLFHFQIVGVDIRGAAVEFATRGIYPPLSFRQKGYEQLRTRYFREVGGKFEIDAGLRERVGFVQANLLQRGNWERHGPFDLVLCRNLLIYLDGWAREQLFEVLAGTLVSDGLMLVGICEALAAPRRRFTPVSGLKLPALRKTPSHRTLAPPRLPPGQAAPLRASEYRISPATPRPAQYRRDPPPPPRRTPDLLGEAQRMADLGMLECAVELCENFLRERGPAPQAYFLLGVVHSASGRLDRAEHYLRRAIYLDPNHIEALTYMALQAERAGHKEQAERYWRRARGVVVSAP